MSEPQAICTICKASKPVSEFPRRLDRPSGHASHCKACNAVRQAEYYQRNKARLAPIKAEKAAQWYAENREAHIEKVGERRKRRKTT